LSCSVVLSQIGIDSGFCCTPDWMLPIPDEYMGRGKKGRGEGDGTRPSSGVDIDMKDDLGG